MRSRLAQIHYQHQCPVLHQICLLLTTAHGGLSHHFSGGLRNAGSLQEPGATSEISLRASRRRPRPEEAEEGSGQTRKHGRRYSEDPSGHGHLASQSGCRATGTQKTRLLDMLHANRISGTVAVSDSESSRVASAQEDRHGEEPRQSNAPLEMSSHATPGALFHGQAGQALQMSGDGSSSNDGNCPWSHARGRELPISEVASALPGAETNQPGASALGQNAQVWGTATSHHERSERHHQVSFIEAPGCRDSHPLGDAGLHATRRIADPSHCPPGQHSMELDGDVAETPLYDSQSPSSTTQRPLGEKPRERQEQNQRSEGGQIAMDADRLALQRGLSELKLANDENWCYINTAFLTTMWAFLCSSQFGLAHWGPRSSQLASLLQNPTDTAVELASLPFFHDVLSTWHDVGEQGDPVEFIAHMMRTFQFQGINLRWEKCVQVGQLVNSVDENDAYTPLILQFDPTMLQDGQISLQQMLREWSNQDGMLRALTQDSTLICVQIDHNVRSGDGRLAKCDIPVNFHSGIQVPIFLDAETHIDWRNYKVVAALAHLGTDAAGHCRSLLKVQMRADIAQPRMFLLTDDWVRSTPIWREPDWFHRNTTCFWLCQHEYIDLYDLQPDQLNQTPCPPDPPQRFAASELLQLFADGTDETVMDG